MSKEEKDHQLKTKLLSDIKPLIEKINMFLEVIKITNEKLSTTMMMVENKSLNYPNLNNIAISYNNKLVEIFQIYQKKGIYFSDSTLKFLVEDYLVGLVARGIECTDKYVQILAVINELANRINGKFFLFRKIELTKNKEVLSQLLNEIEKTLEEYDAIDRKIIDFDLDKDISKLYEVEKGFIAEIEKKSNPNVINSNMFIKSCNEELQSLGIKKRINPVNNESNQLIALDTLQLILWEKTNKVQEKYTNFPIVAWCTVNNLSDSFEFSKQALANNDLNLYKKMSEKIMVFDYLDTSTWIVDMVGEVLSFYGLPLDEINMLIGEFQNLGLEDKFHELEDNVLDEKYKEYVLMKTNMVESSPTKVMIFPTFK